MHQRQVRKEVKAEKGPSRARDDLRALQQKSALLGLAVMAFGAAIVVGAIHWRARMQQQEAEKPDSRSILRGTPGARTEVDRLTVATPNTRAQDKQNEVPVTPRQDERAKKESKSSRTMRGTPVPSALCRGARRGSRAATASSVQQQRHNIISAAATRTYPAASE